MAARRGRGEGSVRQRTDGRWEARLPVGHGQRKSYFGNTKAEALRKLRDGQRLLDENRPIPREDITVARFLADWVEQARHAKRWSTWKSYQDFVNRHLIPALGSMRLAHLQTHHIQGWINRWYAGKAPETPGKGSTRMCGYAARVLSSALSDALRQGLVSYNAALPKLLTIPANPDRVAAEIEPLTVEEANTFMEAIHGNDHEALYLLSLGLGLRQGEALGLCLPDIHLDDRDAHGQPVAPWIMVRQELVWVKEPGAPRGAGHFELQRLKTAKSTRRVALPTFVAEAVRVHLSRQDVKRRQFERSKRPWGNAWGLVFTNAAGEPLSSSTTTHAFQRMLRSTAIPARRYYDLRHSAASFLAARGVPAFDIARLLGHSSTQLVERTYAHWLDAGRMLVASEMDALFERSAAASQE